jgi:hypothetical protein
MSDVLGEPMGARHGVLLWANQPTWGTAVTPDTAVGNATFSPTNRAGMKRRRGPGSANVKAHKPGAASYPFDINITELQFGGLAFLLQALRTDGQLPTSTMGFGYKLDGAAHTKSADKVQDCVLHSLEVEWSAGEDYSPLSARITGVGGLKSVVTNLDVAELSGTSILVWEGTMTLDAAAFELERLRFRVDHNPRVQYVAHGTAPASAAAARVPKYQDARSERITGEVTLLKTAGVDMQAATQAVKDFKAVFVEGRGGVGSARVTIDLIDLTFDEEAWGAGDEEGEMRWTLPFEATTFNITQDTA